MAQKKILWVTNALGCGGAERQMLYMYDILRNYCDYDIRILYYARVNDELRAEGVNTIYIDKASIGKVKTITQIAKYIKENNIDIVHAFGGSSANIYGRLAAAFSKNAIPVGAMLGKRHFASKRVALVNSIVNLLGNWWTVNNLELIPILKRDLRFIDNNKIRLLHNGFVPADHIDYQCNVCTQYDDDKQNRFVFTVVGRLEPVKNYKLFIDAAAELCKKYSHVRFWVVGNGKEAENLQQQAEQLGITDRVRFWGYRDDVDVALSRSDVFVQTSFTEGSPNTIAEAMRAKKPVISTNSTDLSEMIAQGENGYIVESNSLPQLVEAMCAMLEKKSDAILHMGQKSSELFERYFLDTQVAAEFEKFYDEVLNARGRNNE